MDILYFMSQIDKICREKKLSKAEFYNRVGISASAVSQWRTGKTAPSKENIQRIVEVLDVDISVLTGLQKEKPVPTTEDGRTEELLRLWNKLTPERQEKFLAVLRELAEE